MNAPTQPALFVHHVLFYTKATASEADKAALLEGLHKLARIAAIKLAHISTPAVIDRNYTYSWLCFFENAADEQAYQQHPVHHEFRATCAAYWEKVVIYDSIGATYEGGQI